jgi:O-Antigen ligase
MGSIFYQMRVQIRRFLRSSETIAWSLAVLLLPLTSVPFLAKIAGASTVAPISALPLLLLVLIWLVPYLLRGGGLPRQSLPLLVFFLVATAAAAAAFFIDVPPYRGKSLVSQEIPALATLAAGVAFYLVFAIWPQERGRMELSLRLINIGGFLILLWSAAQAWVIWGAGGPYPAWMIQLQAWVSLREFIPGRVMGFTYEPSWLAHQLNVLYLPFWLAASLQRYSAHRFRLWKVTIENLLMAAGVLVLFFSFSRVGVLAFLLAIAYLIGRWILRQARDTARRLAPPGRNSRWRGWEIQASLLAGFGLAFLACVFGLAYAMSRLDPRLEVLFDPAALIGNSFYTITNQLAFAERVVYWATGWAIFNDHPLIGVGLGNAGFFFPQKMPAFGWGLWETQRIFFYLNSVPNIKSMWVRLLTETGILGFAFFASWYYLLWRSAKALWAEMSPLLKTIGLAGLLSLIVFLVEGFSIDSFAMPYLWVSAGLLTAGTNIISTDGQPGNQPTTHILPADME